jgi:hypothetical protein
MTDLTGDDVEDHRGAESTQQDAAQDHQRDFERIERWPFQITLPLRDEVIADGHGYDRAVELIPLAPL